ncbi:50S ribosomal protein L18 [Candidatus Dependentiae bacterium]
MRKKNQKKIHLRKTRRENRVRGKQLSRGEKPRVCVFRSLKNIYVQIIDDLAQKVLLSYSSLNLDKTAESMDKKAIARVVGLNLGKMAVEKSIGEAFFDRGNYLYHGRVKALVDGLRESGLQI